MSNPIKQFTRCEGCRKAILVCSPYTDAQYRQGIIRIEQGSHVALDVKVGPHTASLDGLYCDLACLIKKVKSFRP